MSGKGAKSGKGCLRGFFLEGAVIPLLDGLVLQSHSGCPTNMSIFMAKMLPYLVDGPFAGDMV